MRLRIINSQSAAALCLLLHFFDILQAFKLSVNLAFEKGSKGAGENFFQ